MILSSFFSALGQIGDARFRRVLLLGIALTIALLIAATSGFVWLIGMLTADSVSVPWFGEITWLGDVISWGSFFLFFVLSIFLMMPVASAITSMFLDEVAAAVEDRHYPHLPPPHNVPFWDAVVDTVNFLGVLIGANILALILYVLFPPAAIFIFWGLNGFLLGRDYFTLAAQGTCCNNLDRGNADGDPAVNSAGKPADPDHRSSHVHPSFSQAYKGLSARSNQSMSDKDIQPDRMIPAMITHKTAATPVTIQALRLIL
jgi:CysZ protein